MKTLVEDTRSIEGACSDGGGRARRAYSGRYAPLERALHVLRDPWWAHINRRIGHVQEERPRLRIPGLHAACDSSMHAQ